MLFPFRRLVLMLVYSMYSKLQHRYETPLSCSSFHFSLATTFDIHSRFSTPPRLFRRKNQLETHKTLTTISTRSWNRISEGGDETTDVPDLVLFEIRFH